MAILQFIPFYCIMSGKCRFIGSCPPLWGKRPNCIVKGCAMSALLDENDTGKRIANAKRMYQRFVLGREAFEEAIGITQEEYEMILEGEIDLPESVVDALVYIGFDQAWIIGEGNPDRPLFDKRGA